MLSYRHAFHAGNHADILKHYCLFETISYFVNKNKPFSYIDTHAGAGLYAINSDQARKTQEYEEGVLKLFNSDLEVDKSLLAFKNFLAYFVSRQQYPGSSYLAKTIIPKNESLYLYELHPSDFSVLESNMSLDTHQNIKLFYSDGLQGLLSLLPPKVRRAIIMIDPSYEVKTDYLQIPKTVDQAYKKFSTGCYLIWYPLLARQRHRSMIKSLSNISAKYIQVELIVADVDNDTGMYGSGMWIINPPFILKNQLSTVLPQMVSLLKQSETAHFILDSGLL
ncbi:MAG: 23S rRNA (adenine(2030)-N(6))-methyltransferase RlmJ [Neisseriaceae bacterium]|nr:MAG: 23S rRNA (adenine(2030)-N(6))-methyltransferase RlmJ [Neisseriaceae bacterium]